MSKLGHNSSLWNSGWPASTTPTPRVPATSSRPVCRARSTLQRVPGGPRRGRGVHPEGSPFCSSSGSPYKKCWWELWASRVAPWAIKQVQTWGRGNHEWGENMTYGEAPVHSPSLHLLLQPSPRHPPTLQYQIGGETQVGHGQQGYKTEVGRVGEAGQVADHKVEVDGTDQCHDGGSDGLA